MSALHLDFAAPRRRPLLAWLALAAGALLLIPVADRCVDLDNDLSEQTRQVTRLKRNLKGSERRPASSAGKAQSSRDQVWLEQVRNPQWRDQLQALEQAADTDIALLQLDADFAAGRVQLGAEAKTMNNALAYADHLRDSGRFPAANVDGHDLRQRDGQEVVGFTLTLGQPKVVAAVAKAGASQP